MTTIEGTIAVGGGETPTAGGKVVKGTVQSVATVFLTDGTYLLPTPTGITIAEDGTWSKDVDVLPTDYAYIFRFTYPDGGVARRIVTVPASGTVQYEDLQDVEQASSPSWARPTWVADVESIRDDIDSIVLTDAGVMAEAFTAPGSPFKEATDTTYETPAGAMAKAAAAAAPKLSTADAAAGYVARGLVPPGRLRSPIATSRWGTPSGHLWVAGSSTAGAVNLAYTGNVLFGSRSVRLVTAGDGTSITYCQYDHASPMDATGKSVRVWLSVADVSRLASLIVSIGNAGQTNSYSWQLATGEAALTNNARLLRNGDWVGITLPWSEAIVTGTPTRASISQFTISAKDGGAGTAAVDHNGIEFFVPDATFPNGVVSLTFDDAASGQYVQAAAKNEQYGFPATYFIITDLLDTGANLTTPQLALLEKKGNEIAAHSFVVASHNPGFDSMSDTDLEADFRSMHDYLASRGFKGINVGAWPHGARTPANEAIASRYVAASRGTPSGSNIETLPPATPMNLRCLLMTPATTVAAVKTMIDRVKTNGEWLILTFHNIVTTTPTGFQYSATNYNSIVDYLATQGVAVRTVTDVLRTLKTF